jgi:uncharacterized protein
MLRISFASISLLLLSSVTPGSAASFDCSKAKSVDELAVCKNPNLSEMDSEMGALWFAYRAVPMLMGSNGVRQDEAQQFLHDRAACASDVPCLKNAYQRRISTLRSEITQAMQAVAQQENGPVSQPPPQTSQLPAPVERAIGDFAGQCQKLGGTLAGGKSSPNVLSADFDGDGKPDYLLDPQNLRCTSAATAYCGNGGCQLAVYVSGNAYEKVATMLGGSPTIVQPQGNAFLEVWVSRAQCNLTAANKACWAIYSWKEGQMQTTHQIRDAPTK